MTKFQNQYRAALRASTPLVAVRTADPMSAINQIMGALNGKADQVPMMVWDLMRGLQGLTKAGSAVVSELTNGGDPAETTAAPTQMLTLLTRIRQDDAIVVMMNAHEYWKDAAVKQGIWNLRDQFKVKGQMLVMTTGLGGTLPDGLDNDVLVLDEPLPTTTELTAILHNIAEAAGYSKLTVAETVKAIDAVIGLAAFPAEQALAMSTTEEGIDFDGLWERKRQAVENQAGLSVYRGEAPEPVGLENARQFLTDLMNGTRQYRCVLFLDEVEKMFAGTGTDLSGVTTKQAGTFLTWTTTQNVDGVLFIGVAGGGKSMLAKWAAGLKGIPTVVCDVAGMQSGIIGSTEQRERAAFATVDAISQGDTLMIGTCNSIGQLTPEQLRRFNRGIFFFDLMSEDERQACWDHYGKKCGLKADQELPDDEGWTGAEIEQCCRLAAQLRVPVKQAANYIVPISRSSAEKIKALRTACSGRYISASKPGTYLETQAGPSTAGTRKLQRGGPVTLQRKGGNA